MSYSLVLPLFTDQSSLHISQPPMGFCTSLSISPNTHTFTPFSIVFLPVYSAHIDSYVSFQKIVYMYYCLAGIQYIHDRYQGVVDYYYSGITKHKKLPVLLT